MLKTFPTTRLAVLTLLAYMSMNFASVHCFTIQGVSLRLGLGNLVHAQEVNGSLQESLAFYASFDSTADADIGADRKVYTAETLARKTVNAGMQIDGVAIAPRGGKYGDGLRFSKVGPKVLMYRGVNVPYAKQNWSGTVSMWMRLDPDKELPPDYCDPLQITERAWNDAAFFVDFDKGTSRDFRLGMFSDYKRWNPTDIKWEVLPVAERPMVTVKQPPFARDRWTHVAFSFSNINPAGEAKTQSVFYLNGELQGALAHPQHINWDLEKTAIMLGINYIGDIDEFAIFRRVLTPAEIQQLSSSATSPLGKK